MNDFVNEIDLRYAAPSRAQVDHLIAVARRMRRDAMREALTGLWEMLRRNIGVRHAALLR